MPTATDKGRIELLLPLPPKELSPNARLHHFPKASATNYYRTTCYILGVEAREKYIPVQDRHVWCNARKRITETYRIADKRRHDLRNLFASFKAGEDGLVAAALMVDDNDQWLEHGAPRIERVASKKDAGVFVVIEAIADILAGGR